MKKLFKNKLQHFEKLDLTGKLNVPEGMTTAYRNDRFTVMVFETNTKEIGKVIRALVQQNNNNIIADHWHTMQQIKNELFGAETMAIEYYPKVSELVDTNNIYWMWIFEEGVVPVPSM